MKYLFALLCAILAAIYMLEGKETTFAILFGATTISYTIAECSKRKD